MHDGVTAYVATKPCGCAAEVGVVEPGRRRESAVRVAKAIIDAGNVRTVTLDEARGWPWACGVCRPAGAAT